MCQIAKNALYKEQKRRGRTVGLEWLDNIPGEADPAEAFSDYAQAMELHRQLHELREPYREAFMLRVFGELSFKEIADMCERSESWAKVTFYWAKDHLIRKLDGNV